jgi:hypothetical protein
MPQPKSEGEKPANPAITELPPEFKSTAERWHEQNADVVMKEPPHECEWKIGDVVKFTNEYGLEFGPYNVVGYTTPEDELHGRFIYIDTCSPWFPASPDSLTKWEEKHDE